MVTRQSALTMISLSTAAHAAGVNRTTILRAIKSGKVSATKNEHGEWQIDPAELHRVYPPPQASPQQVHDQALADAVAELRLALADTREQRDKWQAIAERLVQRLGGAAPA